MGRVILFDDGEPAHFASVEYQCQRCGLRAWQETGLCAVQRGYVVLLPDICTAWLCTSCGGSAQRTGRYTPLDWAPKRGVK